MPRQAATIQVASLLSLSYSCLHKMCTICRTLGLNQANVDMRNMLTLEVTVEKVAAATYCPYRSWAY